MTAKCTPWVCKRQIGAKSGIIAVPTVSLLICCPMMQVGKRHDSLCCSHQTSVMHFCTTPSNCSGMSWNLCILLNASVPTPAGAGCNKNSAEHEQTASRSAAADADVPHLKKDGTAVARQQHSIDPITTQLTSQHAAHGSAQQQSSDPIDDRTLESILAGRRWACDPTYSSKI